MLLLFSTLGKELFIRLTTRVFVNILSTCVCVYFFPFFGLEGGMLDLI